MARVEVATGHLCLFLFTLVCACKCLCIPGLVKRMLNSRKLPLIRTLTTYPEAVPLIRKGGKMAPGS